MVVHDVLKRSRQLPHLLRGTNDELRRGHQLICCELEEVWHMRFEPFFYPSENVESDTACPETTLCPGGWLDLDDMFLTARLLTRYVAELVGLIGSAVSELPNFDRDRMQSSPPDPQLQTLVEAFSARVPWIGATLLTEDAHWPGPFAPWSVLPSKRHQSTFSVATRFSVATVARTASQSPAPSANDNSSSEDDQPKEPHHSSLNDAIAALDNVLTVHLKNLVSDLHRTMYQTFVRMCTAYVRWKRAFAAEREMCSAEAQLNQEDDQSQPSRGNRRHSLNRGVSSSLGPERKVSISAGRAPQRIKASGGASSRSTFTTRRNTVMFQSGKPTKGGDSSLKLAPRSSSPKRSSRFLAVQEAVDDDLDGMD